MGMLIEGRWHDDDQIIEDGAFRRVPSRFRGTIGNDVAAGLRAEADIRNEKINYKVREHSVGKVPVILACGMKEVEEGTVSVRRLGEKQTSVQGFDEVLVALTLEATPPDLR